jgi:predicted nucleotidyltransferase
MTNTNITMLIIVAEGLGDLLDEVVFVGGAVVGLYATHSAAPEMRPTDDVDCVIEVSTRLEYHRLEEKLRSLGFLNDTTQGAPLCRWKYKGVSVDVMPTDTAILGFTNMWYNEGIAQAVDQLLPDGTRIKIFSPPYLVASKIEAHKGRGTRDIRTSSDFEDIVYVFDNREEIMSEVAQADESLRIYLQREFKLLLADPSIEEGITSALPYGSGASRVTRVKQVMQQLSDLPV